MRFILSVFFLCVSLFSSELVDFKTLNAKFSQKVTNATNSSVEYSGELFLKENNILWKYQKPIEKNVYIKDSFVIVDEPEIEQAIFTSISGELNLINMLNSAKKTSDSMYEVEYNNVKYHITLEKDSLKKVQYKDQMDNSISIVFSSVKKDVEIKDTVFSFNPPEYYDIIRK